MANYAALKAIVDQDITTNGQGLITGAVLNQLLKDIITSLGAYYQFGGIATPTSNPGNPDQRVFYLAVTAGTYTNFNSIVLPYGISVLTFGSAWSANTLIQFNSSPAFNSSQLITSGGLFNWLDRKYFVGQGQTYVEVPVWGLLPGITYTLYLSNYNWPLPSSMLDSQNKLAIDSISGGVKTNLIAVGRDTAISEPISFTVPANSEYILIGGRAEVDYSFKFEINIANVSGIYKLIDEISKEVFSTPNILALPYNKGSLVTGYYQPTNNECISCLEYIPVTDSVLTIVNRRQLDNNYWKVRVGFYAEDKTYISQVGYEFVDGAWNINVPANAKYMRFSLSLCNGTSGAAIGCTPSSLPTDGTTIYYTQSNIDLLLQNVQLLMNDDFKRVNVIAFPYSQGSIFSGTYQPSNTDCISCLEYIPVTDSVLTIVNRRQLDNNYWKVRVGFYAEDKTHISQVGYEFVDGAWNINVPANAKYMRFSLSLCNGTSGSAIGCTPSSLPTDGTTIYYTQSNIDLLLQNVQLLMNEVSSMHSTIYDCCQPLPLNALLGYKLSSVFSVTSGYGDAACYNGYIFQFIDGNQYCYVHNATSGALVQTITMPNPNTQFHNNSVSFGPDKYQSGDTYPLLYASQEHSSQNKCIVYRITGSAGSFVLSVVQTITYPSNANTGLYFHNCYIDGKNRYLILSGLVNSSYSRTNGNSLRYLVWALPNVSAGNVTLNIANILQRSLIYENYPTTQGGFCKNGYLYQVFGIDAPQSLMVMDIATLQFKYVFSITDDIGGIEPEGAFDYDNAIYIVMIGGAVYKLVH